MEMAKRILVAYASKRGGTAEIAERIGAGLRGAGLQVDVLPADRASDPAAYDAVALGSAVYYGNWRKEAANFIKRNEAVLAERPVWIFSSGPTGEGDPVELAKGWRLPEGQRPIIERIRPRDVALFHGVLDPAKLNPFERLIIRNVKAPAGDFRDWEAITSWAEDIAAALK